MQHNISKNGIELIKKFEGCRLTSYQDQVGVWTVGYGSTHGVTKGMTVTLDDAEHKLLYDLDTIEHHLNQMLVQEPTQNQFDALCSFAYNLGYPALRRSTLMALFNQGKIKEASNEFTKWCMAGGKENKGLKNRREAEKTLFLS